MLNGIRDLQNNILKNALFVIDRTEDSFTAATVFDISAKISAELKLNSNDIYHRVFRISDSNIGIRASLYFEKQMLDKYITNKSKLQYTVDCINRFEIYLTEQRFFDDYEAFLHDGPFHHLTSWRFISDAAMEYGLFDNPTTRNKWTVDKVKNNVAQYICNKLGNHIAEALIEQFESDVKAADLNISVHLSDNIDVSGIRQVFNTFVVAYIFRIIMDGVTAVFTVLSIFFFTENLNSRSFRDKIAKVVYKQVMEKKEGLIWCILTKFKEIQLSRLQEIRKPLNDILIETAGRPESRNEMDCFYHELKIIASRYVACILFNIKSIVTDHVKFIFSHSNEFCLMIQF